MHQQYEIELEALRYEFAAKQNVQDRQTELFTG
jgi:hypothetical protein